jgi:succinate-semialdehyde dehydrogenase/glutarate-semialdehyde dehydrogenase
MKMLIGGKRVDSLDGKTIDVINPATGEFLDTVPIATEKDVEEAVRLSKDGQKEWSSMPLLKREEIIERFLILLEENKKPLMALLARECGKSPVVCVFELNQARTLFPGYIETAKRYDGKMLIPGTELGHDGHTERDLILVVYEPIGTVAAIVPFNAPLLLFSYKVAPALAAGNSVVVKPPTDNPLTVIKMAELMLEAGIPGNTLQVVTGKGSQVGNWLVSNPGVDAVTFTGSTEVGVNIAETLAKRLSPCCLELGGNDPFIVLDDTDIDFAAGQACGARTGNAGQVCIAPKRFLVQNSIKEEFTKKLINLVKKVEMGFNPDVEGEIERCMNMTDVTTAKVLMGSLINEDAAKTVEQQVNHTIKQGARLALGGKRKGAFYEPTVLTDVTKEMDVSRDMEIFGPVFPIIGFDSDEEAIAIANSSKYGLSGNVMTNNWKRGMKFARAIQSGGVVVNGSSMYRNQMQPFGGYKMSGMGREGFVTLGEMVQEKTIVFKDFLD